MFRLSTTIKIGITFLFCIALSSETNTTVRRCHWCGPLAEQVHRSRRAPPCDSNILDTQITDCEPGFNYCAIVASSPPFIESRYCVKTYQDECYSLYCSTTDSWKMICPCRDDLCNSNNTEREEEAFKSLKKITTVSPKRRATKKSKLVKRDLDEVTTVVPDSNNIVEGTISPCDQLGNLNETSHNTAITNVEDMTTVKNEIVETKDCEVDNVISKIETVAPNSEAGNQIEEASQTITGTTPTEVKETMKAIEDNNPNELTETSIEIKPTIALQIENQITEGKQEQIVNEDKLMEVKPSAELLTGETSQDSVTPVVNMEKSTEHSTTESPTTTLKKLNGTLASKKNTAPFNVQNLYLFILSITSFILF